MLLLSRTLDFRPLHYLHFMVRHVIGYHIETFEALIVNTLTSVQKFHYLIASLRNKAKDLISNLQITHENFSVAWNLITQRYNNTRLIAVMHASQHATSQKGRCVITP
jgi:hypothetical protein